MDYKSSEKFFAPKEDEKQKERKKNEAEIISEYLEGRIKFYSSLDSVENLEDIKVNKKVIKELRDIKTSLKARIV